MFRSQDGFNSQICTVILRKLKINSARFLFRIECCKGLMGIYVHLHNEGKIPEEVEFAVIFTIKYVSNVQVFQDTDLSILFSSSYQM